MSRTSGPSSRCTFFQEPTSRKARRCVAGPGGTSGKCNPASARILPSGEKQIEPASKSFVNDAEAGTIPTPFPQRAVSQILTVQPGSTAHEAKWLPSGEKADGRTILFVCFK